jgi:hypothetical protein
MDVAFLQSTLFPDPGAGTMFALGFCLIVVARLSRRPAR